jgi:hypothetical protein
MIILIFSPMLAFLPYLLVFFQNIPYQILSTLIKIIIISVGFFFFFLIYFLSIINNSTEEEIKINRHCRKDKFSNDNNFGVSSFLNSNIINLTNQNNSSISRISNINKFSLKKKFED